MILLDLGGTHIRTLNFNKRKVLDYNEYDWSKWTNNKRINFIEQFSSERVSFSFAGIKHPSSVFLPSINLSLPFSIFKNLVSFENDINLVALAYKDYGDVLTIGLGTGMGLGVVKNSLPILGNFGEIGHAMYSEIETYEDHFTKRFHNNRFEELNSDEQEKYIRNFSNLLNLLYNIFFPKVIVFHGSVANQLFLRRDVIVKYFKYPTHFIMSTEKDIFRGLIILNNMKK